jgi:hypothetical protein
MPVHKLADGPCTMTVTAVRNTEGNFGPQVEFTDGVVSVYVNEMPAQRGLARLGMDLETVVGATIRFHQVKKDGKTFTNLDLARPEDVGTPTPSASAHPVATTAKGKVTKEQMFDLYGECVREAVNRFGAVCDDTGVPYDSQSLQAAAATLFIQTARML